MYGEGEVWLSYYKVWPCGFFDIISHCKVRQSNFITKCHRMLWKSASGITKCDRRYYKVRQVLQSVTVITNWDVTSSTISSKNNGT